MYDACGTTCSNYEAEILGNQAAMNYLHTTFKKDPAKITNVVIFTDSMSDRQAMGNDNTNTHEVTHTLLQADKLVSAFAHRLVLQWILGHADIHVHVHVNDKADRLA